MSKEAMTQALEALLNWKAAYPDEFDLFDEQAITALRGALAELQEKYIYGTPLLDAMTGKANEALDKMAENARDIGLDYEHPTQYWRAYASDYERGVIDGMQKQMQSSVDRAVNAMAEQPAQQEPVSLKSLAQKAGINLPETYIPTMDDAIAAGDSVLMNEQAALLRECRAALDSLIAQKPTLAGLLCGSTTLGNLKAELGAYRPKGVMGTPPASKPWVGLTDEEVKHQWEVWRASIPRYAGFATGIEAKLREKNTQPIKPWTDLTEEDAREIIEATERNDRGYVMALVEAKLREKNT